MLIKDLVKKARIELMLSQKEFGKIFGISNMAVYYYEKGLRNVPNKITEYCIQVLDNPSNNV